MKKINPVHQSLIEWYRKDWVNFVHHALGHITWEKQREIIRSVQHNELTAVRAAHGQSKTYTAAEISVLFYNLFPGSRVVTTAPVFDQVQKLLWPEIKEVYKNPNVELIGRVLDVEVKDPENPLHFMYGFSTNLPERAEGHHSWYLLFIFDEAKGIEQWMWDAARGAMGGGFCRWLAISTTDGVEIGSQFWNCFQDGTRWNTIHISAYDSPYTTGESFEGLEFTEPGNLAKFKKKYVTPEEAMLPINGQKYLDDCADPVSGWGKGSVMFKTKAEGMLCDIGTGAVVRLSAVMKMFKNGEDPDFPEIGAKRAGIDVSWGGQDDTVCFKAEGFKVLAHPLVITSKDLPDTKWIEFQVDQIEGYLDYDKEFEVKVDVVSGGIGVFSEMQSRGWKVIGINNGTPADKEKEFANINSEMWFDVSTFIHEISCPTIPRLKKELVNRNRAPDDKPGRYTMEGKKEYIKRMKKSAGKQNEKGRAGWSPDFADAFINCFAGPKGPGGFIGDTKVEIY